MVLFEAKRHPILRDRDAALFASTCSNSSNLALEFDRHRFADGEFLGEFPDQLIRSSLVRLDAEVRVHRC